MLVLGVVLILLAIAGAVAATVNEPTASTTITVFDRAYEVTATQMFVLGVITAALFLLGLALLMKGVQRARARRKELRYARFEARDRVARLEEEKRELQRRLETASPADTSPADTSAARRTGPTGRTAPVEKSAPAGSREAGYAGGARANVPSGEERTATTQPRGFIDRLVAGGRREGTPRR